jgi:2-amino-4-hydroxy-6-hydroxymethyldihydropteridine diphosphokinase
LILIALGANLPSIYGKPDDTLEEAKRELARRGISIMKSSKIMISDPVPVSDQPKYRNAVVSVSTVFSSQELLAELKSIEADFGREDTERNAARVLDLDLIAYDGRIIQGRDLMVPHPRMHQRAFVLGPLMEIAPNWVHPVLKRTAAELFHSLPEKVSRETVDKIQAA